MDLEISVRQLSPNHSLRLLSTCSAWRSFFSHAVNISHSTCRLKNMYLVKNNVHLSMYSSPLNMRAHRSRHTDPPHTITSRTHDCQNTPRAISFSAAYVHTVRAPGPEDKACPSNLPVSKDAPAQSQHTHSAGASQPTTTLRSEEHSVFYTTLFSYSHFSIFSAFRGAKGFSIFFV